MDQAGPLWAHRTESKKHLCTGMLSSWASTGEQLGEYRVESWCIAKLLGWSGTRTLRGTPAGVCQEEQNCQADVPQTLLPTVRHRCAESWGLSRLGLCRPQGPTCEPTAGPRFCSQSSTLVAIYTAEIECAC